MTTEFKFKPKQKVKHIKSGAEGVIDTCGLDQHGDIYYVQFPGNNVSNHWLRPDLLIAVD